jgi:hypothetical protein
MKIQDIPFGIADWSVTDRKEHAGSAGIAQQPIMPGDRIVLARPEYFCRVCQMPPPSSHCPSGQKEGWIRYWLLRCKALIARIG